MGVERVERRLAAIVAVDVAGYSRLMGRDEEDTLAALRAIRRDLSDPRIKEHQGRIVKTTGDGLLIEFASVVGAVRCSVEVQRAMAEHNTGVPADKRIDFRVGIHQGDIIVEDGDIFGDGVNLAARLEGLAEPGGICVSRVVRDEVRDKLDIGFDDLGEQHVKNIARPVHVFRILDGRIARSNEGVGSMPTSSGWAALKKELNSFHPDKAELIRIVEEDPQTENVGSFPVDEILAKEIANAPKPNRNEMHGILADEPRWQDDPVVLRYVTARYKTIEALRRRNVRPKVLSACALVCNAASAEIVLHRRASSPEKSGKYPDALHVFGGNFRAGGDEEPDGTLGWAVQRELEEESHVPAGSWLSDLNCVRVLSRETSTGFIQLTYLGIDFSPDRVGRMKSTPEGRPVRIQFSKLEQRLIDPDEKWVHSGQLLVLLWLALGAPVARADGLPPAHRFDPKQARRSYRRVMSRLRQSRS